MHNINTLKTQLNSICHLLALLGAHHILHVSRIRVKEAVIDHNHSRDLRFVIPCIIVEFK